MFQAHIIPNTCDFRRDIFILGQFIPQVHEKTQLTLLGSYTHPCTGGGEAM